ATIGLVSHTINRPNEEASAASSSLGAYNILPNPVITPDGKWIAYTSFHDDLMNLVAAGGYGVQVDNVYLFNADPNDATTYQKNFRVNHRSGDATPAGDKNPPIDTLLSLPYMNPSISDNGRYVAFLSSATNLTSTASTAGVNVFLYDRLAADSNHNVT